MLDKCEENVGWVVVEEDDEYLPGNMCSGGTH